jgi:hypothetical protein
MKMTDNQRPICVALLEYGATWQPRFWGLGEEANDAVVVQQQASESEDDLLGRLAIRCSELAAAGLEIGTAVFACRIPPDESRLPSSVRLVSRLLAQLTAARGAKLVLVTEPRRGATLNGLLALGGAFIESWVAAGLSVEVRSGSSATAPWPDQAASTRPRRAIDMGGPGLARAKPRRIARVTEQSSPAR